ncbi:2-amino-4-hydroxy-6-hydroxymethyldihydropteridine diphosphokinase [Roseovarius sp.]|uniref:2-amino-4-hydroxy-6- hydroxymethyldihydropteridine diphosphokinase n=2 Tax=Roseovarius TaxID=74030 RepID=UPI003A985E15
MLMTFNQQCLIAIGGNMPSAVGGPAETLRAALDMLRREGADVVASSGLYSTPCFPAGVGPDYVNGAAVLDFAGGARDVLALLHRVEAAFGRERVRRWGQRTLDLDLIAVGNQVLPDPETFAIWHDLAPEVQTTAAPDQLILPHPRMQDRAFVLVPLADVAPEWVHPVLGKSVRQMLEALPQSDRDAVVLL